MTILSKETEYLPEIEQVLIGFGFELHTDENAIRTYHNIWLGDHYFHKVILFPNGMIEFIHFSYGRVFYAEVESYMLLTSLLEVCFPDLVKMIR